METISNWFRPNKTPNEQTRQIGVLLNIISTFTAVLSVVLLAVRFIFFEFVPEEDLGTVFGLFLSFFFLFLIRQGYQHIVGFIFPLMMVLVATFQSSQTNGVWDSSIYLLPTMIVLAGFLMGIRGIISFGGLAFLSLFYIGMIAPPQPEITMADTTTQMVFIQVQIVLVGGIVFFIVRSLNENFRRIQANEASLADRNKELQQIRDSLEDEVKERTKRADAARQRAEEAQAAMARQVWLTTGLVQVNDQLRQQRTVEELANSALQQVCLYLGIPVGALFIRTGRVYSLTGRYAYPETAGQHNFEPGEGLVGQCVLEKKLLVLPNTAANPLKIRLGFTHLTPQKIVFIPLMYQGQVEGVLELGYLQEPSAEHLRFLQDAGESIAIALVTTFNRLQIEQLLAQSS